MSEEVSPPSTNGSTWEIDVGLLNNRAVVGGLFRAFAFTGLISSGLLGFVFAVQGEWDAILPVASVLWGICAGLFMFGLFSAALVLRNRIRFRYTVSADGILLETIDRTVKVVNRLAIGAGVLGGSPATAGTGLIATSGETQSMRWDGAFNARYDDRARVIALRNAWRTLLYVYCTPENYADVSRQVRTEMSAHATETRVPADSPVPRLLARTALVVVACLPSFALVEAFEVSLLIPIILLCFALAMVWLVSAFAWVVIGMLVVEGAAVLVSALSMRTSYFLPGTTYAYWTVFSGDDWALIAVTALSFAVMGWVSVRSLRGASPSMLESDHSDMGN